MDIVLNGMMDDWQVFWQFEDEDTILVSAQSMIGLCLRSQGRPKMSGGWNEDKT